jgi:hypothetical protein
MEENDIVQRMLRSNLHQRQYTEQVGQISGVQSALPAPAAAYPSHVLLYISFALSLSRHTGCSRKHRWQCCDAAGN